MSWNNRRNIDLWIMLHSPEKARKRLREVCVSVHSQLIIDESRPTKISGSNSIVLKSFEDIFLVQLQMDPDVSLFVHLIVNINQTGKLEADHSSHHYIGYRNLKIEPGFAGHEILIEVSDFQLYSLCRPQLTSGFAA